MAMSPGNQAITGGTVLRTPAIQSPNYVAGVSGWIVRSDGSAEFNAGTFRGSIEVGSLTGQHFWVNNPNTTDVIDVYNSANKLVFAIDTGGVMRSFSSVATTEVAIANGSVLFEDTGQSPQIPPIEQGFITAASNTLQLSAGLPQNAVGGAQNAELDVISGTTTAAGWLQAHQRGVTGPVLQLDANSNANQLVHIGAYNVTTDAAGTGTFNHLAAFTPMAGFLMGVNGIGANFPYQYAWFTSPFTSTTAKAAFKDNLGAALASTTLGVFGVFYG